MPLKHPESTSSCVTRRSFLQAGAAASAYLSSGQILGAASVPSRAFEHGEPLSEFQYGQVRFPSGLHQAQLEQAHSILVGLNEDSLLRPFRLAVGLPAPGRDLGGWYSGDQFGPGVFGQWLSALSRYVAITGDEPTRAKVQRLAGEFLECLEPAGRAFRIANDHLTYSYDKIACGLGDAQVFAQDPVAPVVLARAAEVVSPLLLARKPKEGEWYTVPENAFIAWQRSGDARHLEVAREYLHEEFFDALAQGKDMLPNRHAYSHVNALSSAAKAFLVLGEKKYLRAAINGFSFVQAQSFATGAWGPNEAFLPSEGLPFLNFPPLKTLGESLAQARSHFETPCGSYAHFKLTRYLLRITKDSRYGDSMEQVMYNTVLGAKPINKFGKAFYQSNYHSHARKEYFDGYDSLIEDEWPCCSGTLPQIAADYRISTYFRDPAGVFVNLYIPSTLSWKQRDTSVTLTQTGNYPLDEKISLEMKVSRPTRFSIRLRIPEWTRNPSIRINGKTVSQPIVAGRFATLRREWLSGDRIELELPRTLTLKPVDGERLNTVALVSGPLVLFALSDDTPKVTRAQLLAAKQSGPGSAEWCTQSVDGPLRLVPFWEIKDETYFTYFSV